MSLLLVPGAQRGTQSCLASSSVEQPLIVCIDWVAHSGILVSGVAFQLVIHKLSSCVSTKVIATGLNKTKARADW